MFRPSLSALALILAFGGGLPALAQSTDEAPDAAPAAPADEGEAATSGGDPSSDLSMGTEIADGDQLGSHYVKGDFGSWEQRCTRSGLSEDPCELYILLKDDDDNNVAELAIFNLPEGAQTEAVAGATFTSPLETLLTAGLQLAVDGGKARAYPFTVCTISGCIARIGLTAAELDQFKKGAEATFSIVPFRAPDQKVSLSASLSGFTAGYDAVVAQNVLADEAARVAAEEATQGESDDAPEESGEAGED